MHSIYFFKTIANAFQEGTTFLQRMWKRVYGRNYAIAIMHLFSVAARNRNAQKKDWRRRRTLLLAITITIAIAAYV